MSGAGRSVTPLDSSLVLGPPFWRRTLDENAVRLGEKIKLKFQGHKSSRCSLLRHSGAGSILTLLRSCAAWMFLCTGFYGLSFKISLRPQEAKISVDW